VSRPTSLLPLARSRRNLPLLMRMRARPLSFFFFVAVNSSRSLENNMRGEPDSIVALAKWSILNRLHDWNDPLKDPSVGNAARGKKRGGTGGPRSLPSAFSLPLSHPAPKSLPGQATSLRLISSTLSLVALPFLSFFLLGKLD